jgi:hypothetical protein
MPKSILIDTIVNPTPLYLIEVAHQVEIAAEG